MKRILISICASAFLFACNNEPTASKTNEANLVLTASDTNAETDEWVPIDSATAMKTMMEAAHRDSNMRCYD